MSAVSAGREDVVTLLLAKDADINAANSSGQTALHYAVRRLPNMPLACSMTRPATSCKNSLCMCGITPMNSMQASKDRTGSILKLLLAKGASVNAKDSTGSTPLHR